MTHLIILDGNWLDSRAANQCSISSIPIRRRALRSPSPARPQSWAPASRRVFMLLHGASHFCASTAGFFEDLKKKKRVSKFLRQILFTS